MTVYVFLKFMSDFRMRTVGVQSLLFGVKGTLLLGVRIERTGMGVFLKLGYQKSFRRPSLSSQSFE